VLTLVSATWAPAAAPAVTEFDRLMLYLGVFLLVSLSVTRRVIPWCADGLGFGLAAVGILALLSRFFPGFVPSYKQFSFLPVGILRLSYPVGYWNALAVLMAIGLPLVLRTVLVSRSRWLRWPAAGVAPLMVTVIYLTSSRTGIAAAAVGLLLLFALSARPIVTLLTIATIGVFSVVALLCVRHWPILVDGPFDEGPVTHAGARAAPLLLVVALASAVAISLVGRIVERRPIARRADRVAVVAVAVAVVAAIAVSNPPAQFDTFKRPPTVLVQTNTHLVSGSGNGRWQLWSAAAHQFEAHPLLGGGAGSFRPWWERHRTYPLFVQNAHSLYMDVLAELGVAGVLLLLGIIASIGVAFVSARRRAVGAAQTTAAALGGAAVALLVAAGTDWVWQVPVVVVAGLVTVALLSSLSAGSSSDPVPRRVPHSVRTLGLLALGLAVIVLQALPMLETLKIRSSEAAAGRGDTASATRAALSAHEIAPWDAMPYLQLALIEEQRGDVASARNWIIGAISHSRADWQLWLVRARLEAKLGDVPAARRSLARLRELNPLAADRL
jgi:hypothetical protein